MPGDRPAYPPLEPSAVVVGRILRRLTGLMRFTAAFHGRLQAGEYPEYEHRAELTTALARVGEDLLEPVLSALIPHASCSQQKWMSYLAEAQRPARFRNVDPESMELELASRRDYGNALRILRGSRTQASVARSSGVVLSSWSCYETGRNLPRPRRLDKMLLALGYSRKDYELLVCELRRHRLERERLLLRLRQATSPPEVAHIEAQLAQLTENQPKCPPRPALPEAA